MLPRHNNYTLQTTFQISQASTQDKKKNDCNFIGKVLSKTCGFRTLFLEKIATRAAKTSWDVLNHFSFTVVSTRKLFASSSEWEIWRRFEPDIFLRAAPLVDLLASAPQPISFLLKMENKDTDVHPSCRAWECSRCKKAKWEKMECSCNVMIQCICGVGISMWSNGPLSLRWRILLDDETSWTSEARELQRSILMEQLQYNKLHHGCDQMGIQWARVSKNAKFWSQPAGMCNVRLRSFRVCSCQIAIGPFTFFQKNFSQKSGCIRGIRLDVLRQHVLRNATLL